MFGDTALLPASSARYRVIACHDAGETNYSHSATAARLDNRAIRAIMRPAWTRLIDAGTQREPWTQHSARRHQPATAHTRDDNRSLFDPPATAL